jgi:transcriptional regulator with XRE-family HTH domain
VVKAEKAKKMATTTTLFGRQLKYWRQVQGLSQLSLATIASTTTRHISFLENGRSRPSDRMVERLAEALEIPVRERNTLMKAAGFAASYPEENLDREELKPFLAAIQYLMQSHAPYPAILKNRYHEIMDLNEPAKRLFMLLDPMGAQRSMVEWLLEPTSKALGAFENYHTVAWGMIYRIRGEAAANPSDERMQQLANYAETRAKELGGPTKTTEDLVTCPTLLLGGRRVRMMGMVARFGSAREATLDDLCVELMHPRDEETAQFFKELSERPPLRIAH